MSATVTHPETLSIPYPLLCSACGSAASCTGDELVAYVRYGWPRCCGEEMSFYDPYKVPSGEPGPVPAE